MYMQMSITPMPNVDKETGRTIDQKKISTIIKHWNDKIKVKNHDSDQIQTIKVSKVSIYENILILCGLEFKIVGELSKQDFE